MAMKLHHHMKVLALMILIVLGATGIDWLAHQINPEYAVSSEYFSNKIIYATLWGLLGLLALRNLHNVTRKAILISLFISVVLQTKYYLQGYDLSFVIEFIFVHFLAFLLPMTVIFRNFPELFGDRTLAERNKSADLKDPFSRYRRPGKSGH